MVSLLDLLLKLLKDLLMERFEELFGCEVLILFK